ncbi:MAG TPA: EAL domain-containing protein [Lacipirellulaceae bacterium]|jgi:EAL domain-containing protein (putative c-di-GMP-specific phosphodiesterase class I)|nr:EAL domain-containing protein [Lacipirellulaceae bacterium]
MLSSTLSTARTTWLLAGQVADDQPVRHVRVDSLRFIVGRKPGASLCIPSPTVSREHAELTVVDRGILLRDLGSTNGTFVNGTRIHEPCTVHHSDLLQFGQVVFRVVQQCTESGPQTIQEDSCDRALALIQFDQLMTQRAVTPHVQPIVKMENRQVWGAEVLARSRFFGLKDPHSMFAAAKVLNLEGELSRILREEGVRCGQILPTDHALFVNTHPVEMDDLDLMLFSLSELRELEPRRPLMLEIHEASVTCGDQMRNTRAALKDLQIGLAYDDFGAGQARLVELVDVPPDYLKFDMRLVQNLESASIERLRMLASLVKMVTDLGITPLAEGIELEADHEICRQMGFQCGQGFLYGFPVSPKEFAAMVASSVDQKT